jgi:hypothetical protein
MEEYYKELFSRQRTKLGLLKKAISQSLDQIIGTNEFNGASLAEYAEILSEAEKDVESAKKSYEQELAKESASAEEKAE